MMVRVENRFETPNTRRQKYFNLEFLENYLITNREIYRRVGKREKSRSENIRELFILEFI